MGFEFFKKFRSDTRVNDIKDVDNHDLDEKVTIKIEQGVEQYGEKIKLESRLNTEEALLYQDYATTAEITPFSEEASQEAYAEADMFIAKLREKGVDLSKIDWEKINLVEAHQHDDLEKKLDVAVSQIIEAATNNKK